MLITEGLTPRIRKEGAVAGVHGSWLVGEMAHPNFMKW